MKERKPITYSKERVVLSDVLPYETPLTFSNRHFYNYLKKRRFYYNTLNSLNTKCLIQKNSSIRKSIKQEIDNIKKNNIVIPEIEKILFQMESRDKGVTKPFIFRVSHKKTDYRELSVIHPYNQYLVSEFYNDNCDLILYYSSISQYSIRKPVKVAQFVFYDDRLHKRATNGDLFHSLIEDDKSEYENLKSYFKYSNYSNIHKFYESYKFHRCEKKYNKLLKIDISKCFDSIYSHTITWAILNKSIVKENINASTNTFGGKFDYLMQKLNANETNGIVIGPEFSRIFAELILQQIDKDIFDCLKSANFDCKGLIHKVDYEILRYVDDYFIFFNDDFHSERILKEFKLCLKEYKMHLNESKSISYVKPIITEISIAKQKVSDLFNSEMNFLTEFHKNNENIKDELVKIHFICNNTITRFKSIIKESQIEYKEIMNYSLAVLDKKTEDIINSFNDLKVLKIRNADTFETEFTKALYEILDVSFFLYSVTPRVNFTIKLCIIIDRIITFLKVKNKNPQNSKYHNNFNITNTHLLFKKISDEITLILNTNKSQGETQVETLYLLIALSQLGREYRIEMNVLCTYFNIEIENGFLKFPDKLNYFSITVLIFYIKKIIKYTLILEGLKIEIIKKFEQSIYPDWKSDSEMVLLLMDLLVCPYLNNITDANLTKKYNLATGSSKEDYLKKILNEKYAYKKLILNSLKINDCQIHIIEAQEFWFTKWTKFDFGMELHSKRSQEVY
nr:antiviral reverse transcriptase Drt3b [uncultured Flavobacterium sp.]